MTDAQRLSVVEAVYEKQPNLLASVLVQRKFGASHQEIGVLTELLLICREAMRESGETWPLIAEELQEKMLGRLVGHVKFPEGLPPKYGKVAIAQWAEARTEKWLLAAALLKLQEHGLARLESEADKFVVLAALNMVECIAHAKHDA